MYLSIVIPCYNEAENLERLALYCQDLLTNGVEIILVDNGSTDNTQEEIKKILLKHPLIKYIKIKINKGYGYGVLQGLKVSKGDYIGWMHADLQTNPKDILPALKIIQEVNSQNLFIKGKRYGRNLMDVLFTIFMSVFNTIFLRMVLVDINAQPTIFPKSFFASWKNPPQDFSLDLYSYYTAKKRDLEIIRIPVYFGKRIAGEAHLKNLKAKIKYSWKSMQYTLSIIWKNSKTIS